MPLLFCGQELSNLLQKHNAEVLIAAMEEQRLFLAEVQRLRVELERFNQNLSLIANNPREPNVWGLLPPQT
jgi:hypothetical protein